MSVIKRLSLYEFTLWGQDLVSVVRIIEVFLKKIYENFVGVLETVRYRGVRIREVSVLRGSTICKNEERKLYRNTLKYQA